MNVEIVANYPRPAKKFKGKTVHSGTFHAFVELPDNWGVDLRGIYYRYFMKKVYIRYPTRQGDIDGNACQYLVFRILDVNKQKELTRALVKAFSEFAKTNEFAQSVYFPVETK